MSQETVPTTSQEVNSQEMAMHFGLLPPEPFDLSGGNISENWKKFKQKFTNYEIATGINKKESATRVATLLTVIGNDAIDVFNTITWDAEGDDTKIDKWNQVPPVDQNGVILSYTVTYRALPSWFEQTEYVIAPTTNATLTGLNEYTNYSITVFASTIKGPGNRSVPIVVITDEDRPNAPPVDVRGRNESSTSILFSGTNFRLLIKMWNQVPPVDQNGVILSYTVTYRALPSGSEQTEYVIAPTTNATLTGLNEYTNYSITVFASTIKGPGNRSVPIVVITDEDRPNAPPVDVRGRNESSTSIFVQWNQLPPVDQNGVILSYTVTYRALPNGSEQTEYVIAPTTNATLTGLNEYTNYSITVFASTIKGPGSRSVPILVITDEDRPNAPPVDVRGRNESSTSIFVQWNQVPAVDQNGVILSYTVTYRALPSGSEQTEYVIAPTTNATLTGLNEYTNYSITVFASTIKGPGNRSVPIVVITDEDRPNAPPVDVRGRNESSTSIFVQWNQVPPVDQNGVILSYTVTYRPLPSWFEQTEYVIAPTTNATLTGLNEYTNYSITVFASTIKGPGNRSVPIVVITDEDRPNATPVDVRGRNESSTSIFVQWNQLPPVDQNGVILSYTVTYRALPNGSEQTEYVIAPTTNATLTGLNEYTNYSITVFASTIKGPGSRSVPILVITDEDRPNAPPVDVRGRNESSTSIFVQWNQVPAVDQNGVILSYTVTYRALPSGSEQTEYVIAPTTNATLTGLNEYTNYSITVFASTIKGPGNRSVPIVVITDEDRPNAPPVDVRGRNESSTSIFVHWNQVPAVDQNGVILSYTVTYRALPSWFEQTEYVIAPTTNATLTGLNEYTNYSITVFASTIKGPGNRSVPIVVITDEDRPNATPVDVRGRNESSTSIFVQWNQLPPVDQNGVILSYTVTYRALPNGSEQTEYVIAPTTNATLTGLNEYTNYSITVFASTIKGPGSRSVPILVITDEDRPNAPPVDVRGRNESSTSIFVQWNQVPPVDQNGVILSYTVTYRALPSGSEQTEYVIAPTTNATLTGLNEYTNYSITVFASTIKGPGNRSVPIVVITDEDRPNAPPVDVRGRNESSTSIFVQWNQVPPVDQNGVILSYTVTYRALPNGSEQTEYVIAPTTNATLTGLNEYTNYSITVFASTIKGPGSRSVPILVITDEDRPNAPPVDVRGRNESSTSIFVQWNQIPPVDQNGVILSYTVTYRALPNGSEQTEYVIAPTTNATLRGLNEYTNYSITVFASTIKGPGSRSVPILVITDEDRPNAPPVDVRGRNESSTSIFVQWNQVPPVDQNGVILSYTVTYRALPSGSEQFEYVIAPTTNATLTGLNEYTNYSITVFASTIKGPGNRSVPIVVITDEDRPNAPPVGVRGRNESSTSIFVEWNQVPPVDHNGVILSYTVTYRALPSGSEQTKYVIAPTTSATLTGLNEYANYSITVFASTIKGPGNRSVPIVVITDEDIPSAPPDGLKAVDTTSTSILVQWGDVPDSDKNGIITSYTVRYQAITERITNATVNTTTVEAPVMHANLTDLIINVKYNISVLASTVKGDGPYSNGTEVTTNQSAPGAPPSNVRGHNTSSTTILVQWDEVPIERQHGEIISYTVIYWRTKDAGERQEENYVQELEATLQGLEKYTDYNVEVLASTIRGRGPHSHLITVRTDQDTPSASPAITHVMALNSTSILVEWDRVPEEYRNGIITRYTIHYKDVAKKNESTVDAPAPASEITITALRQKALYSIRIRAATSKGDGPWSSATETETPLLLKDRVQRKIVRSAHAELKRAWGLGLYLRSFRRSNEKYPGN
ncbi:phosphatidylinositol phosphatase PTPRQ-like [Montipora capricornis]|uniref:phosphatidylinositol phosphatase PTPRQ-like n=1 Tax=Montipora capricornis TaxID=246305 RepID=UPI0035F209A1